MVVQRSTSIFGQNALSSVRSPDSRLSLYVSFHANVYHYREDIDSLSKQEYRLRSKTGQLSHQQNDAAMSGTSPPANVSEA